MATYFRVPDEIAVRVKPEAMQRVVVDLLKHAGMSEESAGCCAEALVYADVRGIDTHGVSNMLAKYIEWIESGEIKPQARWQVVRENLSTATIDSDHGLGLVVGSHAMNLAIQKASSTGLGMVTIKHGGHFGAMAYFAAKALEHGMIGIAMTAGGLAVAPTGGSQVKLGTNPLGIAAPTRDEAPFIFDATMTTLPYNKLNLAKRLGAKIPAGMMADSQGKPIMHAEMVPDKAMLLPLGSTPELGSHKGFGLLAMIDILTGVLAGQGARFMNPGVNQFAHQVLAIDIGSFSDPELFLDHMDQFMTALRETPPLEGTERVLYAGLLEQEIEQERRAKGIPYHPEVVAWFNQRCEQEGIEPVTVQS